MEVLTTPCFVVDAALGRLAKWLRIAGFDTIYDPTLSLAIAKFHIEAGKTLLTRKITLFDILKGENVIHIQSDHYQEQLREVIQATGLESKHLRPFSRCTVCNLSTANVSRTAVAERVPDYILENIDTFFICHGCMRVYWRGSHSSNILAVLARFF